MEHFANLQKEVIDMDFGGYTVEEIAEQLGVTVAVVNEVLMEFDQADYDGQPDEAQEWYDFDPDC